VALNLVGVGGKVPAGLERGSVLLTPEAWLSSATVDVVLTEPGRLPAGPQLHVGATSLGVRVRPLDDRHVRLTLSQPLPLRVGDRALLRDPGSREVWGVRVLDPAPPGLGRRGAAALRAKDLRAADGSLADELTRRGFVRRSLLRRIGVPDSPAPSGSVVLGDLIISASTMASWRDRLPPVVEARTSDLEPGVPVAVVAHDLALPTPDLVAALVEPPLSLARGRVYRAAVGLPEALLASMDRLEADLAASPFAAPDADRLKELGLDARALGALAKADRVLRVSDAVVLLPGADAVAVDVLRRLPQPFTTSEARTVLRTTRRVVLPLLTYLDRRGLTTRLPDDRRRVQG
jgi:selenocysteine-specific elongation factor